MPPKRTQNRQAAKPAAKRTRAPPAAQPEPPWQTAMAPPAAETAMVLALPGASRGERDEAAEVKRRRLARRDSDCQVERTMANKLGHFPAEVIESAVNAKNETVRDYIKRHMKELRGSTKRLGSRFWVEFFEEFPLKRSPAENLAPPEGEESVRDELVSAVAVAHAENPAARSVDALELVLLHTQVLNRTEMYGLLRSAMEGPIITKMNSTRMLIAILGYIARVGGVERYQDYWSVMRDSFDQALRRHWQQSRSKGILRHHFVQGNKALVSLFMDGGDIERVLSSVQSKADLDANTVIRLVKSSSIGSQLFDDLALKLDFLTFMQTVNTRLSDLEHLDFSMEDVRQFRQVMSRTTAALKHHGQKYFDKKKGNVDFLNTPTAVVLGCLDDEWSLRLDAKVKSIAVNAGALALLPWEKLVLEKDKLPGIREVCPLPSELLQDMSNCRDACLGFFGNGFHTVADMRRLCNHHSKALLSLDRSFVLELAYLNDSVEDILSKSVRDEVMNALPSPSEQVKLQQCMLCLEAISSSSRTAACGEKLQSQVSGILGMVKSISMGVCPTRSLTDAMTPFYGGCLKRMEHFCTYFGSVGTADGSSQAMISGAPALKKHFDKFKESLEAGHGASKTLKDAQMFRTFRWMLSADDAARADTWIGDILKNHVGARPLAGQIKDADAEDDNSTALACAFVAAGGASSSSSSSKAAPAAQVRTTKGHGKKGETRTTTKEDMMKFFAPKSK